ncbi:MAG: PilZ domain-containing protein [Spirochaetales bacterium]|nr:PilZ domain-containing protein [Spirochaetales bacterium]
MKEKRRHKRIPFEVAVTLDMENYSKTRNISSGGICIETRNVLKKGNFTNLSFSLPGNGSVKLLGRIVWIRKEDGKNYICGLEFIFFSNSRLEKVREYIALNGG